MAKWRCAHRRSSPLLGTFFADLASWPGYALAAALECDQFPRGLIRLELEHLKCPACRAQDRRVRRGYAGLVLLAMVLLLVGWRCFR